MYNAEAYADARVAKLADARDLKSRGAKAPYRFDSDPGHQSPQCGAGTDSPYLLRCSVAISLVTLSIASSASSGMLPMSYGLPLGSRRHVGSGPVQPRPASQSTRQAANCARTACGSGSSVSSESLISSPSGVQIPVHAAGVGRIGEAPSRGETDAAAIVAIWCRQLTVSNDPAHVPREFLNPLGLALGDFNADGKQDVVVAANPPQLLLGNGDGTLQAGVQIGTIAASDVALSRFQQ